MHLLASFWLWHPLDEGRGSACSATDHSGCGYAAWSGILGSFIFSLPAWALALSMFVRRHNCHVRGCPWPAWHDHPVHGHPVCRKHHPESCDADGNVTRREIG